MTPIALSASELLAFMPQTSPFRFVDEVLEVDAEHIVGRYTFRKDEPFYPGHFPDRPITPGVILLEAMAQCGLVLHGLYLLSNEVPRKELPAYRALFTEAAISWHATVLPGERVTIRGDVTVWRRQRIRSNVSMHTASGSLIASGEIGGMGVRWQSA